MPFEPDPRILHDMPEDVFIYFCAFLEHREFVCWRFAPADSSSAAHVHQHAQGLWGSG